MIKQMPDRLRETEQEVRQLENDRTRLRKLQPIWTQCRTVHGQKEASHVDLIYENFQGRSFANLARGVERIRRQS